jgi:hypothetical protein
MGRIIGVPDDEDDAGTSASSTQPLTQHHHHWSNSNQYQTPPSIPHSPSSLSSSSSLGYDSLSANTPMFSSRSVRPKPFSSTLSAATRNQTAVKSSIQKHHHRHHRSQSSSSSTSSSLLLSPHSSPSLHMPTLEALTHDLDHHLSFNLPVSTTTSSSTRSPLANYTARVSPSVVDHEIANSLLADRRVASLRLVSMTSPSSCQMASLVVEPAG